MHLAALWPRLHDALPRDRAPSEWVGRRGTQAIANNSFTNADVAAAVDTITITLADLDAQARRILNTGAARRAQPTDTLRHVLDWWQQLDADGQPLAAHLVADLAACVETARRALGLTAQPHPIGKRCPHHRGTAPTGLLGEAAQATVHPSVLAGRGQARPQRPGTGDAVTWKHTTVTYCPHCQQRWEGVTELRQLARLIAEADRAP